MMDVPCCKYCGQPVYVFTSRNLRMNIVIGDEPGSIICRKCLLRAESARERVGSTDEIAASPDIASQASKVVLHALCS